MKLEQLPIAGSWLIVAEAQRDERGSFARVYCDEQFRDAGIRFATVQCNLSTNVRRGLLRGLHFQAAPHEEAKIVRCVRGSAYDVMLDLRADSPTYLKWHAVELSADNQLAVLIPEGCAHGFQTLDDDVHIHYQMSAAYAPASSRGVRWDDRSFGIAWPIPDPLVSEADRSFAPFDPDQWRRDWTANSAARRRGPAT